MSYQTQDQSLLGTGLGRYYSGSHNLQSGAPLTRLRAVTYTYQDGPGCGACSMGDITQVEPSVPHFLTGGTNNGGGYKTLNSYCQMNDGYKASPVTKRYD